MKGNVNTVKLSLSGSSDFEMNGKGSVVNVVASGSSDVKMSDFHTETLQVSISGSSDMSITISVRKQPAHYRGLRLYDTEEIPTFRV